MNIRIAPKPVLLAASLALAVLSTSAAAPREFPPMTHRVTAVERHNGTIVEPGTTILTVRQLLGTPHRKLADDVWVYDRFTASRDTGDDDGCHTLVITFAKNRVADLRLVNSLAEQAFIVALKSKPAHQVIASAK